MTKIPDRRPVEVTSMLQNLDADTLRSFSSLSDTEYMVKIEEVARRLAQTRRNEIIDLDTEDERRLANEISNRKGQIYSLGVIVEIIKGAKGELNKRKVD